MVALLVVAAPVAFGATALFPRPLHLVRQVDDPISKTTATIDEYCAGNRVVTIRGSKVIIADYDAQQLTEVDHAAQTWSVTAFADIAKSRGDLDARIGLHAARPNVHVTALGRASNGADAYEISEQHRRLQVAFNRNVTLSRAAAEVLIGVAWPNGKGGDAEDILAAAANGNVSAMSAGASSSDSYGLLVERTLTIEEGGSTLVSHNVVTHIGEEIAPAEALIIEPGAKRVESRLTRLARELREIDTIPSATPQR
jgi:hypothetical protein